LCLFYKWLITHGKFFFDRYLILWRAKSHPEKDDKSIVHLRNKSKHWLKLFAKRAISKIGGNKNSKILENQIAKKEKKG